MSSDNAGLLVVNRIATLLRLLAANNRNGMKLVEVLRSSGLERSTAHRLLQSLVKEGMVFQDRETKRYYMGTAIYEMGVAVPSQRMRDLCLPHLREFALSTKHSVFLSVRSGFDGVCVDREEGGEPIAYVAEPGRRRPLSVGVSNIALLGCLSDFEIDRIRTENWPRIMDRYPEYTQDEISTRIRAAKQDGYVVANVPQCRGVKAAGMAIQDSQGRPLAAISLSAMTECWSPAQTAHILSRMHDAVAAIQNELAISKRNAPYH